MASRKDNQQPRCCAEVNEHLELVRLIDPALNPDKEELFRHTFDTFKLFIKDGTHQALEGRQARAHAPHA